MDEEQAKRVLAEFLYVPRETFARLELMVELIRCENERQNLISRRSFGAIWARHILDSAQLVRFAPDAENWLDLGTGAGFPGLVIAALHPASVTMVESRGLRADFLHRASVALNISDRTRIVCARLESVDTMFFDAISARAFAPLDRLFGVAHRFASTKTRWVLPKGRSAQSELDTIRGSWQGVFHVEPSLTDTDSGIIIAERVSRTNLKVG